ncbi:uncharacterized protein RAG0_17338 [Rhynchosporium agropyri]|uniref:Tc1-like transposase DDE domain-containing protein n=1 Tax=Rhynchosporium agropyri TaxID=914238 RepID=A0A1E1LTR8_9HELO|nr:uncharacterized protein RAG0_17338 [Rhynchosporium agropyri]
MAPNLASSKHDLIQNMILDKKIQTNKIAEAAKCSERSIKAIRSNIRHYGTTKAPSNGGGRLRSLITPLMIDALCEHLLEKPGLYLEEIATFYGTNLRRSGWDPLGVAPVHVSKFHRGQRYQILPAYSQSGILLARVFKGSTDGDDFKDFLEQLLPHCGKWPEPKSVLIMDNASFHRSERVEQMCNDAGVKLVYLPPYSPDLNPIEEFFAELKVFIKKHWQTSEKFPEQDFAGFPEWCIGVVGDKKSSAEGHFRHAGITVEEL